MSAYPPAAERIALAAINQVCCCGCTRCDFDIGTITVAASGSFSYVAEYESTTDPGYWDHETLSFAWNCSGTFTQVMRDASPPAGALGDFVWHNQRFENTHGGADGRCDCDTVGGAFGLNRTYSRLYDRFGTSYVVSGTTSGVRHLVVDRDDPSYIVEDNNIDIEVRMTFGAYNTVGDAFPYWDAGQMWITFMSIGAGFSYWGPPAPNAPPAFGTTAGTLRLESNRTTSPCAHPYGTYTASIDDSSAITGDPFYTITNTGSVTVTVNGSGGTTNCSAAPEAAVDNALYSYGREDGGRYVRQDGGLYLRQ